MKNKVTVIGAGNVGASTALYIAERGLADVTLIDPALTWTVDVAEFRSKSVNSPFHGWTLQGRAVATIVGGRVKHRLG